MCVCVCVAGTESEMATKLLPSQGRKSGQSGYIPPAVSAPTLGAGAESEMATQLLLSQGPKSWQSGYITPALLGVPNAQCPDRIRHCYLTSAVSGPQSRKSGYITPAVSEVPNAQCGERIKSGYLTPGPKSRQSGYTTPPLSCPLRGPQHSVRGENQKWLPHPCRVGGGGGGGQSAQSGDIKPVLSGVPNAQCRERIRNGYLTPAVSGEGGGGGKVRKVATSNLSSPGSPTLSAGRELEMATKLLPSQGRKSGQSGYITPAVSAPMRSAGAESEMVT